MSSDNQKTNMNVANPPKIDSPKGSDLPLEELTSKISSIDISKSYLINEYNRGLVPDPILIKNSHNPYLFSTTNFHPFSFLTGHRKWGFDNTKHLTSPSPI